MSRFYRKESRGHRVLGALSPDVVDARAAAEPSRDDLVSAGLLDYWKIILQRKYLILGLIALGALTGFLITIPAPFVFSAKTVIEIQDFNPNFMGIAQLDPQASNYLMSEVNIATQIQLLQGGTLKTRVLDRLNRELAPTGVPEFPGMLAKVRRRAQDMLGRTPKDPLAVMRQALQAASRSLSLQPVKGTRLLEITCHSTVPEVASAFTNAVANEYIDQNLEQRIKSIQRTTQWFTTQLQDAKEKLEKSEARLHALTPMGSGGPLGAPTQDNLTASKMLGLQQQIATVQTDRIAKESFLQAVRNAKDPERVADIPMLAPYLTRVQEMERTLTTLNTTLTPAHYKVVKAEADLAEARAALDRERQAYIERLKADLDTVRHRERMLMAAYSGETRAASAHSGRLLDYSLVQREVETNRHTYQSLLSQVNQATVASAVQNNPIRIVEAAEPPQAPSNVMQTLYTVLGGASGLILALGLVVVLHHVDRSVRDPGHAASLLNVRELGVIPSRSMVPARAKERSLLGLPKTGSEGDSVELITWQERPSLLADSFRSTLASILLPHGDATPQVIVTTSPNVKEGKSTVTSNLGIALTELGRRVLLIDTDLRRPRLHEIFSLPNATGLTTLLRDSKPVEEYKAEELGIATEIENLRVLPAGPAPPSINALIYSLRLQKLLERVRKEFDTILIDTPPMVQFADARVLARWADGVILVLRSGVTDQQSAMIARQRLTEDGTWLIGTILNDWRPAEAENRYYRQYHSYYAQTTKDQ